MGMTKVFYLVKKNELTLEDAESRMSKLAQMERQSYTMFYGEKWDWISVFETWLCEGAYNTDDDFLHSLEENFSGDAIALSVFDSDVAFVAMCQEGRIYRHVNADAFMLEEFGFEDYEPSYPEGLERYGIPQEQLKALWQEKEKFTFAEELLQKLADLLHAKLVFGEDDELEDAERICF